MKKFKIALVIMLATILGELVVYNYNTENNYTKNSNTVNALEKYSVKKGTKKTSKKSSKKASKKTTKKSVKKKVKKVTKKYKKVRTTRKNISDAERAELQAFAKDLVINQYGWSENDFNSLLELWYRESGWNPYSSYNGCYGIPQAKPGNKMKSFGNDWKTNGRTQIKWGLNYIYYRYGNPTKAWNHFKKKHWY